MQIFVNSIASASIIAPAAIGFSLVFTLFRYVNFAAGSFMMAGAFAAWSANVTLGLPLWLSGFGAMLVCAALLVVSDYLVFKPLRGRHGGTLLLVSIALSFILENLARFIYGSNVKGFDIPLTGPLLIGGLRVTRETISVTSVAIMSTVIIAIILTFTPIGRALRAVSDNPTLADVRGLPVRKIELSGLLIAGALFGLSGTLVGIDLAIEPNLNWALAIPVIAAAILGGLGSPLGAAFGALIIGFAEELTVAFISPPYKGAVGFAVIAIVLLLRPQGLFGDVVDRK